MGEEIKLTGTVVDIRYQNPENYYTVCSLEDEKSELVTVVGTLPQIAEDDRITVTGSWMTHPVYGKQFRADYFEKTLPVEESDILRYLSSGNVKGIGPKTAARIVARFGVDSFEVIEQHPDWLTEIPGITEKKAQKIHEAFSETEGVRSVMMFCRDFFPAVTAVRIYNRYGLSAVEKLRENPYLLCKEIDGISFKAADRLAMGIGIPEDSEDRMSAGIHAALSEAASKAGHTCLMKEELIRKSCELLSLPPEKIDAPLNDLATHRELVFLSTDEGDFVYLPYFYRAETYCAERLKRICDSCPQVDPGDAERMIQNLEDMQGISYAPLQKKAIVNSLRSGVLVLTGGPGTGKTTIIRALIRIFEELGLDCALAAPTGRAAKRMSEATSHEAKTIHRLLESEFAGEDRTNMSFLRCENNPLDEDVVVIDECSMIDILLFESLLRGVKNGSRLILIGDADQLPSVGAGNVLSNLVESGVFPTVRLTEIFRQAEASRIVTNSHAINNGEAPDLRNLKDGDFFFLPRLSNGEVAETVVDLCANRLPKAYGEQFGKGVQVITPSHTGEAGTDNLNRLLQEALNPNDGTKKEKKRGETLFREGDRVMQIRNDYSLEWKRNQQEGMGVFNGDVGVIRDIDDASESMCVVFDDKEVIYEFASLDELELAYAITVHKSQGSEYPAVVLPVFDCPPMLRTRNLLYTAVTRASRMVILVGKRSVLEEMIGNNYHARRCTNFTYFLKRGQAGS